VTVLYDDKKTNASNVDEHIGNLKAEFEKAYHKEMTDGDHGLYAVGKIVAQISFSQIGRVRRAGAEASLWSSLWGAAEIKFCGLRLHLGIRQLQEL